MAPREDDISAKFIDEISTSKAFSLIKLAQKLESWDSNNLLEYKW